MFVEVVDLPPFRISSREPRKIPGGFVVNGKPFINIKFVELIDGIRLELVTPSTEPFQSEGRYLVLLDLPIERKHEPEVGRGLFLAFACRALLADFTHYQVQH